jgi:hypothetical protein
MTKKLKKNIVKISDIGVLLLGYNRPEMLYRRVTELSNNKVCNVYISIDGGSESRTPEMEVTKFFARQTFRKTKNFNLKHHKKNLGMVKHITQEISNILINHEYIIVIEDDIVITQNFIENMLGGINLQNSLGSYGIISGWSPLYAKIPHNKWRIVSGPSIWGWACSRKTWAGYTYDLSKINIEQELKKHSKWNKLRKDIKQKNLRQFKKAQQNPLYSWDIQLAFLLLKKDTISLSPVFSITGNEGFNDSRATHTKGKKPRILDNKKINEVRFLKLTKFSKLIDMLDKIYRREIKLINNLIKLM